MKLNNLPSNSLCGNGETQAAALKCATNALPSGAVVLAAHWLHIPRSTNPEWRWLMVLAYIVGDPRGSVATTRETVTRL
jgi:hypothetical protein